MFSLLIISTILIFANVANSNEDDRIVGGAQIAVSEAPWQVVFYMTGGGLCGGSIIDKDLICTAAHCTEGKDISTMRIAIGTSTTDAIYSENVYTVSAVYDHPGYDTHSKNNDISILRTSKPINLKSDFAEIIPLQETAVPKNAIVSVSGYGTTSQGGISSKVLKSVDLIVTDFGQCNAMYHNSLTPNMVCAGIPPFNSVDSCQGDSGGPLVYNGKLLGVVSAGNGCANNVPGFYTYIPNYIGWIRGFMKKQW